MSFDIAVHARAIARALLGPENEEQSTKRQLRYGTNGSLAVDIAGEKIGTWYDHENDQGGGLVDLIARERRCDRRDAMTWAQAIVGFAPEPHPQAKPKTKPHKGNGKDRPRVVATYSYHDHLGGLLFQVVRYHPKTFKQRRPDGHSGWTWSMAGVELVPYRLPELLRSNEVLIVEGEKDADNAVALGFEATTNPGGTGKWRSSFAQWFVGRHVVILPHHDPAGRKHAQEVASRLAGEAASIKIVPLPGLPDKGDLSDWIEAGGTADQLRELIEAAPYVDPDQHQDDDAGEAGAEQGAESTSQSRTNSFTDQELMEGELAEPVFMIPGLIPEGLTVLAGRPKMGKTSFAMNLADAKARGGTALGSISCDQGDVLFLALEDNRRRLRKRRRMMLEAEKLEAVPGLTFHTEWPRLDEGGFERLEVTCKSKSNLKMIVIDTWKKLAPRRRKDQSDYDFEAEAAAMLQKLAAKYQVAIIILHHSRKGPKSEDFVDDVLGSTGLTGTCDTVIGFRRKRGTNDAEISVAGRDVDECELALSGDQTSGLWKLIGDAAEHRRSTERKAVLDLLADGKARTIKQVADALGCTYDAARMTCNRMADKGELHRSGKVFTLPISQWTDAL